jgi:hypothetical protein
MFIEYFARHLTELRRKLLKYSDRIGELFWNGLMERG